MKKLLFLFYYYQYYLHLCQEIYYFLILCLNSGTVVPLNTHIEPIWVPYGNGRSTLETQRSMGAIWAPIMYLEIIIFPGIFQFYLGVPHIRIYF